VTKQSVFPTSAFRLPRYAFITIILLLTITVVCINGEGNTKKYTLFSNPQEVKIQGLPTGAYGRPISTEEPFVSRDGRFLFFNTAQAENNKDLHYAQFINNKWEYKGEIGPGINNEKEVQANPTMDKHFNFYYIDSGCVRMAKQGIFSPATGKLYKAHEVAGIPKRQLQIIGQKVTGNMGVEVNPDGNTLYFSRATWKLKGTSIAGLAGSDLLVVTKKGKDFVFDKAEAERIMKNINTSDLEYAASISSDGLEIFFTRLSLADMEAQKIRSKIMRAQRNSVTSPFGKPEMIKAVGSSHFVEGPAITPDEKELYYHKHDGKKFRLFKVTRTIR